MSFFGYVEDLPLHFRDVCSFTPSIQFSRNRNPRQQRRSPTPSRDPSTGPSSPSSPNPTSGRISPANANGKDQKKPLYLCSPFADAALVKGNFKTIVMLPKYVDIMEWVAVNSEWIFL